MSRADLPWSLALGRRGIILLTDDSLGSRPEERQLVPVHDACVRVGVQPVRMPPTRILIVDDEGPIRRGLTLRLRAEPDLAVVGEAPDGLSAVDSAQRLKPDLVLMDVRMPGLDGLSAAALILASDPGTQVIFLTMHDDARVRAEAARLGAAGVVGKQMIDEELMATIRAVAANIRSVQE